MADKRRFQQRAIQERTWRGITLTKARGMKIRCVETVSFVLQMATSTEANSRRMPITAKDRLRGLMAPSTPLSIGGLLLRTIMDFRAHGLKERCMEWGATSIDAVVSGTDSSTMDTVRDSNVICEKFRRSDSFLFLRRLLLNLRRLGFGILYGRFECAVHCRHGGAP